MLNGREVARAILHPGPSHLVVERNCQHLTPENLKGSSGGMVRIDPYSFNRSVQRRDGSASQLNWRAVTLFAVLTPPAIVRHLLVCTFLI